MRRAGLFLGVEEEVGGRVGRRSRRRENSETREEGGGGRARMGKDEGPVAGAEIQTTSV